MITYLPKEKPEKPEGYKLPLTMTIMFELSFPAETIQNLMDFIDNTVDSLESLSPEVLVPNSVQSQAPESTQQNF
jgi:hypothetical protein